MTPRLLAWKMMPSVKVFVGTGGEEMLSSLCSMLGSRGVRNSSAAEEGLSVIGMWRTVETRGVDERDPCPLAGGDRGGCEPNLAEKQLLKSGKNERNSSVTKPQKQTKAPRESSFSPT